jgi:hypothetical protein
MPQTVLAGEAHMAHTLWRGKQLLGNLHVRESSNEELSAVLIPVRGAAELAGTWQTRFGLFDRVVEHPIEPFDVATRVHRSTSTSRSSRPRPPTEGEIQGIASELQLSIRDEAGNVLPHRAIALTEFRFPPDFAEAFPELSNERRQEGRAWMVTAALDAPAR